MNVHGVVIAQEGCLAMMYRKDALRDTLHVNNTIVKFEKNHITYTMSQ